MKIKIILLGSLNSLLLNLYSLIQRCLFFEDDGHYLLAGLSVVSTAVWYTHALNK